jgi:hypothetical protein
VHSYALANQQFFIWLIKTKAAPRDGFVAPSAHGRRADFIAIKPRLFDGSSAKYKNYDLLYLVVVYE